MHSWGWLDWQILSLGKHLTGNFTKSLSFSVFKVLIYQNVEKRSLLTYWKLSKITQLQFLVFRPTVPICTDESVTNVILKDLQTFASVCGQLHFNSTRNAFISCICKTYCFQTMMPITKTVCCRSNLTNNHYAWCHD